MMALNVAAVHEVDGAVGPGRFLVVWLQGCAKRCRGCMNPALLPRVERERLPPEDVAARLRPELTGVCFSGGEPFLQAAPLARLAGLARARGFAVVSYSGYTLEELRAGAAPHAADLLAQLDVLIDGEFVRELAAPLLWRGSTNQRVHLLTGRFSADVLDRAPVTGVRIGAEGAVAVGTANAGLDRLTLGLARLGVHFRPHSDPQ